MSFIIFAWIASIAYGLEIILSKLSSKYQVKNPWLFNFLWSLFILIITFIFSLFFHVGFPKEWISIFLASLFYNLSGIFLILTLFNLDVSVISPLYNLRTVFAVLTGVIFLHERLTLIQLMLIAIIFIAGVFLTMDEKLSYKSFFKLPLGLAIIDMIFLVLMSVFIQKAIITNGFWETTLWTQLISQLLLFCTIPLFKKVFFKISKKSLFNLIIIAILGSIGTLAANKAFALNVGITSAVLSIPLSMVFAIIISVFFPKLLEKHTLKVYLIRTVSAIVIIFAALNLK